MHNRSYKYTIIVTIALSIFIFFLLTRSAADPNESKPKTTIAKTVRDETQPSENHEQGSANPISDIEPNAPDKPSDNTLNVVESIDPSQAIESGWKIIDDTDNPRAGVHVVCTPISPKLIQEWLALEDEGLEPEPELLETFADDNGCFDFLFLEPGQYLIRADAPHWSPALGILDLRSERPSDFSAVMVKEKKIRGKILDCNQQPIHEATIYCYMAPTYPIEKMPLHCAGEVILFKQHLLTDEEGKFEFGGLYPKLNYDLYADYEGCKPQSKIVPGWDKNDQIIVLKKSCILEGRITSSSGKALSDADIFYIDPQAPYTQPYIDNIDENGHFLSDSIPEGFINIIGMHKDYGHNMAKLYIKPDIVNYVELKLPKGVKLHIKVTDEEGESLEGIVVTVQSQDSGTCLISSTTNESGKVTVYSLNKGDHNLIRTRDPHKRYSVYKKSHTFNDDDEINIRLNKRIHAQMIVIDENTKETISDYKACVCSYYKSSALQEVGSLQSHIFEFESNTPTHAFRIAKGEFFEITVMADGYMPGRIIAMSQSGSEIEPYKVFLAPGMVLNGYIVDAISLKPIPGALIQLYLSGRYDKKPCYPISIDRSQATGEDGSFSLSGMPHDSFFLKAQAPGYTSVVLNSLELNQFAPASENLIYLRKGGCLTGRIFSEEHLPLDQAYIQVILPGTNEVRNTQSCPDGSYCLYDLPPGKYEVSVWEILDKTYSDSTMKLQRTVEIHPGQTSTADFTFEGSCTIRGLCTVDGEEGCGIIIHLFDENSVKTHSVDASSTGFYSISSIAPGKYTLEAHSTVIGAGGMIRRPISLQSGQDLTLDLDFKGKAVFGTVTDTEGHPIHAAEVEILTPTFQRNYLTYTDHEGNYTIFNVEEGEYFIAARALSCGEEMKGPWMLGGAQKAGRKADFALKPGGTLRMHVNDSQGNPIPNARVLLSNNMSQGVLWTEKTKYSGIAVFDNLQTESLSALAIAKGYAAGGTTLLAPAGEITDAEITLVQGGSIKVTVKSKNGIPVSGAHVALTDFLLLGLSPTRLTQLGLLSPSNPGYLTDEEGGFSIGLLPPGNYKMQITKGNRVAQASVSITSGQETGVQVVLD